VILMQTLSPLVHADPWPPVGVSVTERSEFFIHDRGPKGSDGCVVPGKDGDLKSLLDALEREPSIVAGSCRTTVSTWTAPATSARRMGVSNAPFLPHGTPNATEHGAWWRLNLCLAAAALCCALTAPAAIVLLGHRPRVMPSHQAACIGPANPWTRPTPSLAAPGSPR